ncbi:hypothetical protein [Streptomyces klenkii]|uniref:hypothetical protein n=1 Tax=Streptomyces klenkii TaxID=1420899 RepID=UPI003F4B93D2
MTTPQPTNKPTNSFRYVSPSDAPARTAGSSTKFSEQWPPLRTAMRLPSRTACRSASSTCSVDAATRT